MTGDLDNGWCRPGAKWWKFDFHTHTPASVDYGKGQNQSSLQLLEPREWLLGFMRAGVDCVAVTDHNTGKWIDRLKDELDNLEHEDHEAFRRLYLFPGVEISVNGGFHLLVLLDTDKTSSDIDALLGAVDYDGSKGDSDGVTRKSAVEVVEVVLDRGGVPIPAHADRSKGLLRLKREGSRAAYVDAHTINQVLETSGILAMELTDPSFQKPEIYSQHKLGWAEVLGSDLHHPDWSSGERFPGSHYTWVKMARPTLQGVKLALHDGADFSIRRSDDAASFNPVAVPKVCIESIEISEARYMGHGGRSTRLAFHPWLNALVGGRGTGKSTVIHALRLVSRRETDLSSLAHHSASRQTFERFNKAPSDRTQVGGLTKSTAITWVLVRDDVRYRVHWSHNGSGLAVEEQVDACEWRPSDVQSVTDDRFPLRLFSQGQIGELAGDDQSALLREIDRTAGVGPVRGRLGETVAAFGATRAQLRELDSRVEGLDDPITIELQDVQRKLGRFEETEHSTILTAFRHRQRQCDEINRQFESVDAAGQRIEELAEELKLKDLPAGLFDDDLEEDRQAGDTLAALRCAFATAVQESLEVALRLRRIVKSQRKALAEGKWEASVKETDASYRNLASALATEGVNDPHGYGGLVQEKQRLESKRRVLKSDKQARILLAEECDKKLLDLSVARRAITSTRQEFLSCALSRNDFVRIDLRPYGDDLRVIERSLREVLDAPDDRFSDDILIMSGELPPEGIVADLIAALPEEAESRMLTVESRLTSLKKRFESACNGQGGFGGRFNNYLERKFAQSPEFLDGLLKWFPDDGLAVEYSRTGSGTDFRPISQASTGQRSAAMLAFLLTHGEEPLVLDQPEDDLDNHLIYDLVVRQMRQNKSRRQIIVVTHNANIVVNGDAEMLHVLSFEGRQCVIAEAGSLQEQGIRDEVCRVMEGGQEAFRHRYRRLGSELTYT